MKPDGVSLPDAEQLLEQLDALSLQAERLEQDLERSQRLATLGTLVGSIAHELNNLLTPVMSYAEMAISSPEDRGLTEKALRKAASGAQKASNITCAILGFLRDDKEDLSAPVLDCIEDAVECLVRDPSKDGVELVVVAPDDLCAGIQQVALQQVFMNLMLNAIEAMRPIGGGQLRIEARCSTWNTTEAPSLECVEIRVIDSGKGMPPELARHVFEPLNTTSGEANPGGKPSPQAAGVGLGLAICRQLVESAGGSIELSSKEGEGSSFVIRLPGARQRQMAPARNSAAA